MRTTLLALVALLCVGCVADDAGQPTVVAPVSQVSHVEGEIVLGSIMLGPYPLTFPIRAWGNGDITLQYPNKPYVSFDGEGGWIVEPITPQYEATVRQQIAAGLVRVPTSLSPAGTIQARRVKDAR